MNLPVQAVVRKVGVVAARFNGRFVDGLVTSARQRLQGWEIIEERVPGSFEIPLAVQRLIRRERPFAVLAFGVIWQGKTAHADLVARTVTDALMRIMLSEDVPVIHQVLQVSDERQAQERCFPGPLNRGVEAAEAVLALAGMTTGERDHG